MKRFLIIIVLLIIIAFTVIQTGTLRNLFQPSTAYAVGDLIVNWGVPFGQPLFSITNSKPGDTFTKTVQVNNGASSTRPVAIRGIKTSETGNLAQVFTIKISQNGIDLYGGTLGEKTLSQFFTDSSAINGIPLSSINSGSSKSYVATVQFKNSAGNEFQNKTIVFDLHIGIAFDIPEACKNIHFSGDPIFGTQGDDVITGTSKNDLIIGFEGNDKIDGGLGNDCIVGGSGNDNLTGGNGNDVIVDMEGNNKVDGGNDADIIITGNGDDDILGGNGNDTIQAGGGNDSIDAGNGEDSVLGEDGNDTLLLGNGDDTGNGGTGTNKIDGGNGKDTCISGQKVYCEL